MKLLLLRFLKTILRLAVLLAFVGGFGLLCAGVFATFVAGTSPWLSLGDEAVHRTARIVGVAGAAGAAAFAAPIGFVSLLQLRPLRQALEDAWPGAGPRSSSGCK